MAKTDLTTLDGALAALNVARMCLNPDHYPIHLSQRYSGVIVGQRDIETNDELDALIDSTCEAAAMVNDATDADPTLKTVDDHKDRWVAVRTE
jgi:hypothetical protein